MKMPDADLPLKLLQIVRSFGHGGGIEHVAYELHNAWRQSGVDARVLTTAVQDRHDQTEADIIIPWVRWIRTQGIGRYLGRVIVVPLFTVMATLRLRQIADHRLVVSHGDSLGGDICVIHAVNKASVAEKWRLGGRAWLLNPMHAWVGLRDRYMIGGLRFRRYVAISTRIAQELQQHYNVPPGRIELIPNGVNTDRFCPMLGDKGAVKEQFAIPSDAPMLLFVGHEFDRKGLAYVIDALGHLPSNVHLLVVGADNAAPFRARARAAGIAAERIVFAGPRRDLHEIYRGADAFVFPTYYEAFGLVCMEAMASGIPLFATRVGGIEDYLQDGVNGRFIERDGADIAKCLLPILMDSGLQQRMGIAARTTAETYTWGNIAERYLILLNEVQAEKLAMIPGKPGVSRLLYAKLSLYIKSHVLRHKL